MREVSQLAVDILNSPSMLPISLGIFGNWGAGKLSLLKLIEARLRCGAGGSARCRSGSRSLLCTGAQYRSCAPSAGFIGE
ncbi:hypothetical protein KA005_50345 [bacterium]|nr:hypothetical protein [bacterium]